jgi:hypothetical protein
MTAEVDDVLAMRRCVDEYAAALDDQDGSAMASLFVPEGRLLVYEAGSDELAHRYTGHEELATVAAEMARLYERTFHFVGNFTCDVDGDRTTGTAYCIAQHLRDDGRGQQIVVMPVRYRDAYVRTPEGWRFLERICTVQWRERRLAIQWPPAMA